jgi:ferredoxin
MAPDFFARDADTGLGFVQRQPVTQDEIDLAEEALNACATGSIGNDGQ